MGVDSVEGKRRQKVSERVFAVLIFFFAFRRYVESVA